MLEVHHGAGLPSYEDVYPTERKGSFPLYENVAFSGGRKLSRKYSSRRGRRLSSVCSDCGSIVVVDESGNSHPIAPKSPLSTVFVPPARPKCPPSNVEALSARFNVANKQETSKSKPETKLKPVNVKTDSKETNFNKSQTEKAPEKVTAPNIAALRARLEGGKDQNKTADIHNQPEVTSDSNNETKKVSNLRDKFNKPDESGTQPMSHLKGKHRPKLPGKS